MFLSAGSRDDGSAARGEIVRPGGASDRFAVVGKRRGRRPDATGLSTHQDGCGDDPIRDFAARAGWWGTKTTGSTVKTGEYQGLEPSSIFWDLDGLMSDGTRTLNLSATGPEDEATQVKGTYFGPNMEANLDYERFPHELEHDPYSNWAATPSKPTPPTPQPWVLTDPCGQQRRTRLRHQRQ